MTSSEIIQKVSQHERELREMGVLRLDLFGSASRGTASAKSDIDFLVELEPFSGLFTLCAVEEYLESLFGTRKVDLVPRNSVYDELKEEILGKAVPCLLRAGDSALTT